MERKFIKYLKRFSDSFLSIREQNMHKQHSLVNYIHKQKVAITALRILSNIYMMSADVQ